MTDTDETRFCGFDTNPKIVIRPSRDRVEKVEPSRVETESESLYHKFRDRDYQDCKSISASESRLLNYDTKLKNGL